MTDPLLNLERVSDPVTYSLFEKDGKRIVLLGDVHVNNEKKCENCRKPKCLNYLTLIRSLDEYAKKTDTDLDVFLEMAAPNFGKNKTEKRGLYDATLEDRLTQRRAKSFLRLYNARKEFGTKAYFHKGTEKQRYHYIDPRMTGFIQSYGFFIHTLATGTPTERLGYYAMFQLAYPSPKKLLDTLLAICFSKKLRLPPPFQGKIYMSKIAKQVYKLPLSDQKYVRGFFTRHFQTILGRLNYQAQDTFADALFQLISGLMDVYAICRLLFYHRKQSTGSTSVILAGAWHTYVYSEFLKGWKVNLLTNRGFPAENIQSMKAFRDEYLTALPHCVKVANGTRKKRRGKSSLEVV